jgi:hypothetical protein
MERAPMELRPQVADLDCVSRMWLPYPHDMYRMINAM